MQIDKAALLQAQSFESPGRPFAIPEDRLSEAQRALILRMEAGPRGKVPINQRIWMHNMRFADVAERFGAWVSAQAPIPPREKEICILTVAAYWNSSFEWHWHEQIARRQGLTDQQMDAVRHGRDPAFEVPSEQVTWELVQALLATRDVPDELFQRSNEVLGRERVLDLIGLMALYGMIAQTVMFYRVQVPRDTIDG